MVMFFSSVNVMVVVAIPSVMSTSAIISSSIVNITFPLFMVLPSVSVTVAFISIGVFSSTVSGSVSVVLVFCIVNVWVYLGVGIVGFRRLLLCCVYGWFK